MKTIIYLPYSRVWGLFLFCLFHIYFVQGQNTPVAKNGQLRVIGTKLCNQYGSPIQLRGMSTHGIQWYGWGSCLTDASLDALAYDWGADILRISLYVQEGGYESDPAGFTAQVTRLIEEATERGMYALVDWHQLTPGDPNANLANARTFFTAIANAHKNKNNIIYDIANEPNGVAWSRIKTYADQMIPVIRAIDSDAVILVGTHGWGSMGISDGRNAQDIVSNPVSFSNIMYTFHFYAKDHQTIYLNELEWASDRLPVFVTEFGSQEASGDGPNDFTMTQQYINLMQRKKISWTNWNYSDDFRSGAVWKSGTCSTGPWTVANLKPAGQWIRERMLNPADDFPAGTTNPAPSVSLSSPTNGSTYTAPGSVTITATASDNGSISKVAFFNGGNWLGEDATAPYSFSWSGVPTGTYSITARATDNLGATTTSGAVIITVTGTGSTNLARNKSVVISSIEAAGFEGAKAVDGNSSTRWASLEGIDPQWIYVDLGATYMLNRIKVVWEAAYAKDYQIQVSTNASTWTTLKTVTGNSSLSNDHTGLSGNGRYIRIYGTSRGTPYGYSIYELEAYGTATGARVNTGLESDALHPSLITFPNPTTDNVTIQLSPYWQMDATITLFNPTGQVLLTEPVKDRKHTFDLSHLPGGLYLVQISTSAGSVFQKVIKK